MLLVQFRNATDDLYVDVEQIAAITGQRDSAGAGASIVHLKNGEKLTISGHISEVSSNFESWFGTAYDCTCKDNAGG